MKSSTSESKLFQSRSKGGIPGRARREKRLSLSILKWAFLIDSDVKLFIKIQCIRFCSWKGRRLNRTLAWTIGVVVITEKQRLTVSSLHSFNVQRVSFTHHGLILSFTDGRTDWLNDPSNEINVVVLLLTGRPTEIPEKDIYLNEARYDEEEGQFRKLKGLKVLWSLTEIYSWINYSWTNE